MIISQSWKVFWILASAMVLCGVTVGQTPPPDQHSLPHLPQPRTLLLDVDFKLNAGAASTKGRSVSLNFTAREKSDLGIATIRDATANVTEYRVLESPDSKPADLSAQPWIPLRHALIHELALRNGFGRRYGERRVMFQVKTDTLTSNVVSDTIDLEPVLKEYRVSASSNTHPLIQYAASQGFQFPLDFYETCQGSCPGDFKADLALDSGSASVFTQGLAQGGGSAVRVNIICKILTLGLLSCNAENAPTPGGTCTTKADYLLFEGRSPNQFWRIKSVAVNNAYVVPHGANRFRAKFNFENKGDSCLPPSSVSVGDVIVEGPEVDDFVDPANPWKNAFVRPTLDLPLIRPAGPGT